MESYVIRIYRRHATEPEQVVGLVEHPENGVVERFNGITELVNILLSSPLQAAATPASDTKKRGGGNPPDNPYPEQRQTKMIRFRSQ